ncbi:hypothetical protein [Asanoa hainanensis]|uniref:hypothetical protein n=1 Tax=Asanoa hainanensis TaxID=560556 RepID=UPI00117FCE2B|nr:hypothetical protein [Asanoa hainanensis]
MSEHDEGTTVRPAGASSSDSNDAGIVALAMLAADVQAAAWDLDALVKRIGAIRESYARLGRRDGSAQAGIAAAADAVRSAELDLTIAASAIEDEALAGERAGQPLTVAAHPSTPGCPMCETAGAFIPTSDARVLCGACGHSIGVSATREASRHPIRVESTPQEGTARSQP